MHDKGRIEVICGSMFCGKTEELIRRVRRAIIARQTIHVFKPRVDDRYGIQRITSHTGQSVEANPVESSGEILELADGGATVIAIDEAQFFDMGLVDVVQRLVDENPLRIIIAGLDTDFRGEPFGRCDAAAIEHRRRGAEIAGDLRGLRERRQPNSAPG